MRVISLGSGSSGNALLVEAGPGGRTKLLIDAGLNGRLLTDRLRQVGVAPTQLHGIFLTHEHSDHIIGLPTMMKRYTIPVLADERTLAAVAQSFATNTLRTDSGARVSSETSEKVPFAVGSCRVIGDIEVCSFPVSHDAVAPCGYLLSASGCRVCVAIDSGEVTPAMLEMMGQADLLVIESNHDRERLLRGPYPQLLKQRILSPTGHLSNDQAADAVLRTWRADGLRWLWLSHLSRTNNTSQLALSNMRSRIQSARANLAQVHISVLPPGLGATWDSTQLWRMPSLWEMQG